MVLFVSVHIRLRLALYSVFPDDVIEMIAEILCDRAVRHIQHTWRFHDMPELVPIDGHVHDHRRELCICTTFHSMPF